MGNRFSRQLAVSGLLTCLLAIDARGFRNPERTSLPNIDNRSAVAGQQHSAPDVAQVSAMAQLKARLPDVSVASDETLGGPSFVTRHGEILGRPDPNPDPHHPIKAFLDEYPGLFGHNSAALAVATIKRDYVTAHNGMRTVIWEQQLDGIPVFEATLAAHVTKRGELINISSHFLPDLVKAAGSRAQNVSVKGAITRAAANIGVNDVTKGLNDSTESKLIWLPVDRAAMRLCWDVVLTSRERGETYRLLVDAQTGETLMRRCLTQYISDASYRVFTSDSPSPFSPCFPTPNTNQPALIARTLVVTNAVSTNASPSGWISDGNNSTIGNNVNAHLDRDANDVADPGSSPTGFPFRVFDFAEDLSQAPVTYTNAAVVQLFYWNNWMHDKLYDLGFTEAAGNFQANNFGRGGVSNDAVQADGQDGSGTNNANFTTSGTDGSSGRMQMYVFDGPAPDRDGDLDAEIILHEYTHGLSNRLVGGGTGISALQPSGMGEGWSDFYALSLLSEPTDNVNSNYAEGGYATYQLLGLNQNYYFGIRRYPYSTDMTKSPLTYKDIDPAQASSHAGAPISPGVGVFISPSGNEVHNMGEVWCVTLWEARANLINKFGYAVGNQLILQLVTDGMKLSPPNPTFLQARDAIIQADLVDTGGANKNQLWAAFAKRGMGFSATSPANSTTTGVGEAYDVPDLMKISPGTALSLSGTVGGPFSPACQTYTLTNFGTTTFSWSATHVQAWLDVTPTGGALTAGSATNISVCVNASANALSLGSYTDAITISNQSSGFPQFRSVVLSVTSPRIYYFPLTSNPADDPGWTRTGQWAFGKPTGGGGLTHPSPDPTSGATSTNVFGVNLSGDYSLTVGGPFYLTTGPLNFTGYSNTVLRFQRWLNTDYQPYVSAVIQVSSNGTTWSQIWSNGSIAEITATSWSQQTFDIKAIADNRSTVYVRWGYQIAASAFAYSGWNIDDIEFLADAVSPPSTDLALTKSDAPDPVTVSSNLTYSLAITNLSANAAASVTVTDALPAGITFVSASSGCATNPVGVVVCNLGTLAGNTATNVTILAIPTVAGSIINTAVVASATDTNFANNVATAATTVLTAPQISVTPASFNFGYVLTGTTAQTSFTVTNTGQATLTGTATAGGVFTVSSGSPYTVLGNSSAVVQVTFAPVSEGVASTNVLFASNGGQFTNSVTGTGAAVPIADFNLTPSNGLAPLLVSFTDTSAGTITNRFWSFGDGATTNLLTNTVTHSYTAAGTNDVSLTVTGPLGISNRTVFAAVIVTNLIPTADLAITKSALPNPVTLGDSLTFSIVVSNLGPFAAGSVTVTDALPVSLTFVSATPSQGSCVTNAGTVICNLTSLATNTAATVGIVVTPTLSGTFTNTATVSGTLPDPNLVNNSATTSFVVPVDADGDGLPDAWELAHGLNPHDPADATRDDDGDGFSNLQEFLAGTDPQSAASALHITAIAVDSNGVLITWLAGGGTTNIVQSGNVPSSLSDLSSNILITGSGDVLTNYFDLGGHTNSPPWLYRIRLVP